MKFQESSVHNFIRDRGLPENTIFKGYVIHLHQTDEFLSLYKNDGNEILFTTWAKLPDLAFIFSSHIEAYAICNEYKKGAEVALLFDTGSHFVIL